MKRIAMMKEACTSVAEDTSAAVIATQQWRLIGTVASAGRGFRIKVTTMVTMLNLRPKALMRTMMMMMKRSGNMTRNKRIGNGRAREAASPSRYECHCRSF